MALAPKSPDRAGHRPERVFASSRDRFRRAAERVRGRLRRARAETPLPGLPKVVIIGGGFGGLYAARELARVSVDVTVIDRRNHHLFQPMLYQVASAALNAADIAIPIRSVLNRQKNVEVLMASVKRVDIERRPVVLDD